MRIARLAGSVWLLLLAVTILAGGVPTARASSAPERVPFCVLLDVAGPDGMPETWRAVEEMAGLGCDGLALHGAGVVEGEAPESALRALSRVRGVRRVLSAPLWGDALASLDPDVRLRVEIWNQRFASDAEMGKSDDQHAAAHLAEGGCVLLPPIPHEEPLAKGPQEIARTARYNHAWGAADYQSSEFFLGRIAVGIVTPEVNGAEWSREELLRVHDAARGAMLYWKARASKWSDHPVYLAFEYLDSLATTKSPLTSTNDATWISPLMAAARKRLGIAEPPAPGKIPDQTFPEVYQVVNFLRKKWTADWCVLLVVGQGSYFTEAPGLGAYAFLGGPLLVSPSRPQRWGLEGLLIHESGHLFFALDEYASGGTSSPCSAVSGYLAVANRNSLNPTSGGCTPNKVPCAMASPGRSACTYTEGMMGIQDSNGDGIRDILSTQPIVDLFERDGLALFDSLGRKAISDTISTLTPAFRGLVRDSPLPNRVVVSGTGRGSFPSGEGGEFALGASGSANPAAPMAAPRPAITMNTLESAEYRIDEGPWRWIRPDSTTYDSAVEDFKIIPSGLSGGEHLIEFRGTNSVGKTTESRATSKLRVVILAVALDSLEVKNEIRGGFTISWAIRGEAWGSTARVLKAEDGGADVPLTTVPLRSNARFSVTDTVVRPGHRYRYRVETEAFGKTYALSSEGTASAPIRDSADRISPATPNPFTQETVISYSVPEGILGPKPPKDGGNKPGPPPEFPTSPGMEMAGAAATEDRVRLPVGVTVTIHDVTGRVVRHLISGFVPGSRIYTARWDGKDDDGNDLAGGVYFSRLVAGEFIDTNKLVLIR